MNDELQCRLVIAVLINIKCMISTSSNGVLSVYPNLISPKTVLLGAYTLGIVFHVFVLIYLRNYLLNKVFYSLDLEIIYL